MEKRVISTKLQDEDIKIEKSLRPMYFDDYIGQKKIKDNLKIYTSGATNIFKYPELSDSTKASELIYALEEKQSLTDFVKDTESDDSDNTGIQVYIGNEAPVESMKDCSVVTATYELQDGMRGTIGIIGPKRMDYDKVVEKLKTIQNQLDDVFKKS